MNKIIILDLETTGLNPSNALIVEIGIVELNLETGVINKVFSSLIKEEGFNENFRHSWIFENSSIKFEDVQNARSLDDVRGELQEIFNKHPVTGYNISFDLNFLKSRGFSFPLESRDIMAELKNVIKIPFRGKKFLGKSRTFKNPKLQEAYNFFFQDSNYIETHRAQDDAFHEAKILYELYKNNELEEYFSESLKDNSDYYYYFKKSIANLNKLLSIELYNEDLHKTLDRMIYSKLITAMETYLSNAFIFTIMNNDDYIKKLLITSEDFKSKKYSMKEVIEWELSSVKKEVEQYLLSIMWHNIWRVKQMYKNVLNIEFPEVIKDVHKAILIRHDIVHRNGKSKDGSEFILKKEDIFKEIKNVELLIKEIDQQLVILNN